MPDTNPTPHAHDLDHERRLALPKRAPWTTGRPQAPSRCPLRRVAWLPRHPSTALHRTGALAVPPCTSSKQTATSADYFLRLRTTQPSSDSRGSRREALASRLDRSICHATTRPGQAHAPPITAHLSCLAPLLSSQNRRPWGLSPLASSQATRTAPRRLGLSCAHCLARAASSTLNGDHSPAAARAARLGAAPRPYHAARDRRMAARCVGNRSACTLTQPQCPPRALPATIASPARTPPSLESV